MKRALEDIAAALQSFDGRTISLLVGEPCFGPPEPILGALERVAREPVAGYGPVEGDLDLRALLAAREGGGALDGDNVVVTHGAKGGLLALLAAVVDPGDEVIHPLPCYPAYPAMTRRLGGRPVGVAEGDAGFSGWAATVLSSASDRTRAVIVSSPSNPSGSIVPGEELELLVAGCRERGIRLVLDEAYRDFVFGNGAGSADGIDPGCATVVRVRSTSKSLALCGWRMGWVLADRELAAGIAGAQGALLNPPAGPPQRALLALADVPAGYFEANRDEVRTRVESLASAMTSAGFTAEFPLGGFYLWVDVRDRLDGSTTIEWCTRLADDRGVGLWPGEDFGVPGFVRLALPQGDRWRDDVAELERRLTR